MREVRIRGSVCVGNGHPMSAVNDLLDESEDLVSELGFVDRSALAYFTAAQILSNALPSRESVPLLAELEHAILVDRIRQIAAELRGLAGDRGAHLWAGVQ